MTLLGMLRDGDEVGPLVPKARSRQGRCGSSTPLWRSSPAADAFAPTAAWSKGGLKRNKGVMGHPQIEPLGSTASASPEPRLECDEAVLLSPSPTSQGQNNPMVVETHFSPRDSSLVLVSSPSSFPGSSLC